jgi:DNA primase
MNHLHKNMAKLVSICYDNLRHNKPIQEYLKKRNISKKTIDSFFIGVFPNDLRVLLKEFEIDFLLSSDILFKADYSQFKKNPLIIPVVDVNNNFIGIGGRTLMSAEYTKATGYPKYVNSKYDKANHLFGLNLAKNDIRQKDTAVIVEGYFDVITSHQYGLNNVVATCGTFLSSQQLLLLSRYGKNIKLLFDNDPAGKRATEKAISQYINSESVSIEKISLPENIKDIDEHINKNKPALDTIL